MKNPLTFRVESNLGAILLAALGAFLVGFYFLSVKNLNSETSVYENSQAQVINIGRISAFEKQLMLNWIKQNHIDIPSYVKDQIRYLIDTYPNRPWLQ